MFEISKEKFAEEQQDENAKKDMKDLQAFQDDLKGTRIFIEFHIIFEYIPDSLSNSS
jgi:hypothetical protein